MRYVLTNAEMRAADEFTMESGVSSRTLMERAGKAVAKLAEKALSSGKKEKWSRYQFLNGEFFTVCQWMMFRYNSHQRVSF